MYSASAYWNTKSVSMVLSLTNLPSEILYMILTKVYEEPQNLTIHSPSRLNIAIAPNSYLNSLLVNRLIYDEALKALRHHTNNTITLNRHAVLTDLEPYLPSSSLACFLQSIRTFDIPNFPYGSIIIRCWKQSCPKIDTINVSRIYSPTANAAVHSTLMRSSYTSLLRGDVDNTFANAAINCILRTHQNFRLADIPDNLTLRVPNVIDFWSPHYEQEYYHENRVLVRLELSLRPVLSY